MAHMMSTRKVHGEQYEDDDEREDDDEDAEKHDGDDDHGDGVTILIFAPRTRMQSVLMTATSMPSQP